VLGEVDQAFYDAMEFLSLGRLEIGAEAVGRSQFLLDRGMAYAGEREAFGSEIGAFQSVAHKLARGRARNWAADAAGLRLAWLMNAGRETVEPASIFKWLATDVYFDVADDVVQVHGANGLAEENPFMDRLQYARLLRIVEGTDEIQLNTVARQNGLL
jgi:acyl-CoA dehydrogenase